MVALVQQPKHVAVGVGDEEGIYFQKQSFFNE
jgi:hypothetical protein